MVKIEPNKILESGHPSSSLAPRLPTSTPTPGARLPRKEDRNVHLKRAQDQPGGGEGQRLVRRFASTRTLTGAAPRKQTKRTSPEQRKSRRSR